MSIMDTLFHMTEWIRTTRLNDFALSLGETSMSVWIDTHFWTIPILQTIHILAIAAAFGSIVMMNMRILGITGMGNTMSQTVRRYQPWIWWAVLVLIVTGTGICIGEPPRTLINAIFWIKMVMVVLFILANLWFQASVRKRMADWETTHQGRQLVRVGAVLIILLWLAIMFAGRWIAYAPT